MPILGDLNSKDPRYLAQIREILDEDRKIYKQVFDREKKQVALMGNEQVNPQDTTKNLSFIDQIQRLVEKFNAEAENVINELKLISVQGSKRLSADKFKNVLSINDLIINYNNMMRMLLNPSASQSQRNIGFNNVLKILPYVQNLMIDYNKIILEAVKRIHYDDRSQTYGDFMPELITVYALTKIMYDNLQQNNIKIIEPSDVEREIPKIINSEFKTLGELNAISKTFTPKIDALIERKIKNLEEEIGRPLNANEKKMIEEKYNANPAYKLPRSFYDSLEPKLIEHPHGNLATLLSYLDEYKNIEKKYLEDYNNAKTTLEKKQVLKNKGYESMAKLREDLKKDKDKWLRDKGYEHIEDLEYEIEKEQDDLGNDLLGEGKKKRKYIKRKNNAPIVYEEEKNESYAK